MNLRPEVQKFAKGRTVIMKICQKQMLKTCRIENDPFIGMCKVYGCKVIGMVFPCLFDVTPEILINDHCGRCEKNLHEMHKKDD